MQWVSDVDWRRVLVPDTPILEILVRGTSVYLFVLLLFRFVFKRQSGSLAITDLIVVVFVADAAQNAMADDYRAVPDGLLLVAVIVLWAYVIDWLDSRFPRFQKISHPEPLVLVEDGRVVEENMKKDLVTREELMMQVRLKGVEDLARVERAYMESNGQVSVILKR